MHNLDHDTASFPKTLSVKNKFQCCKAHGIRVTWPRVTPATTDLVERISCGIAGRHSEQCDDRNGKNSEKLSPVMFPGTAEMLECAYKSEDQ
jgi:hypothetical protein